MMVENSWYQRTDSFKALREMKDLFVSLDYSRFFEVKSDVEKKLDELVAGRHEYPMWPSHGDNPCDEWEEDYHGPFRHNYYQVTLYLLGVVRMLRELS